jgi:NADPH:quinone reductase-like Zn-dependent oxidoreductase
MRAVRLHGFGGVDQLKLDDVPVPTPGANEVRIKVGAAAVNPIDWKIRSGFPGLEVKLPFIPGCEGAGTISAVGAGVKDYQVGQRVWGFVDPTRSGWYAEEVVVPVENISFAPPKLDDAQAATMPVGVLTATQAFERADIRSNSRVLVLGGAGSIGSLAVQVARSFGAWVLATASTRNQDFLREVGANEAIDYTAGRLAEVATEIDVVFDTVGSAASQDAYATLVEGGRFISIVSPPNQEKLAAAKATGFLHRGSSNAVELIQAAAKADLGILKPNVAEILRLTDVARAHAMSESGHVRGKLILIP